VIKGCAISMNNAILLKEEVRQLRAVNAKQTKKRAQKKRYLASGRNLLFQEGQERLEQRLQAVQPAIEPVEPVIGVVGRVGADEPIVHPRAPRTCSICRSLSHTARTCPAKEVS
jgi:hypothetical protein